MKVNFLLLMVLIIPFFNGCSNVGMMTAVHNGKMYWNPGNCTQYKYYRSNPDELHCLKDNEETGVVLKPANQQQINNEYKQQVVQQRVFNNLNQMNRNLQLQNQSLQQQQLNNTLNGIRYGY